MNGTCTPLIALSSKIYVGSVLPLNVSQRSPFLFFRYVTLQSFVHAFLMSDIKQIFKRWPRLYNALFYVVGPSLLTGITSRRFVQRFASEARVLHAGSGTKKIGPNCTNVDILPLAGVDVVANLQNLPFEDG